MSDFNFSLPNSVGSTTTSLNGFSITGGTNISSDALSIPASFTQTASSLTTGLTSSLSGLPATLTGLTGGINSEISNISNSIFGSTANQTGSIGNSVDFRVRIRPQVSAQQKVYGPNGTNNILNILYETNGMFFPYTPTISWNQAVEYEPLHFIHSNQDYYAYKNTPSTKIDISGQWSLQNQREGEYLLASIHFLRTVSKMYFGQSNPSLAGMPPPVLLLSGYGDYMFNDLPVIVMNHSYTLDNTVDYVTIQVAGGHVRLPSLMQISVSLVVQHTPTAMRKDFDLDKFRTGELMRSKGWI
jgi:hypothetical protein